jgi:hypothetical protein
MAKDTPITYGLLAKFDTLESLLAATRQAYEDGYRKFDAYTPYPVEGLSQAMHLKSSPLPYVILLGGILGAVGGFFMLTYATVVDNRFNIGGRPYFSWPAYIPITFELTILLAALAGILGLFIVTRFPQPYHPVFNSEDFRQHASQDAFYLSIEASDPHYDLERTRQFLQGVGSSLVTEIDA